MAIQLLSNASATGNSFQVNNSRDYVFSVDGTFGGATVTLQLLSPDGSSWLSITNAAFTAEGAVAVFLGADSTVRVLVASGIPSALYAALN